MRISKKQIKNHIDYCLQSTNVKNIELNLLETLRDLSKFPLENKNQIKFYFKCLEFLITKYE